MCCLEILRTGKRALLFRMSERGWQNCITKSVKDFGTWCIEDSDVSSQPAYTPVQTHTHTQMLYIIKKRQKKKQTNRKAPGIYCICLRVSTWEYELEILISDHDSPLKPLLPETSKKGRNCKWLETCLCQGDATNSVWWKKRRKRKWLCLCMCVNVHCMNVSEKNSPGFVFFATTHSATAWLLQKPKTF